MRRRLCWLLLLSTLLAGGLACQGNAKDPIGDYPNAGGLPPISDFPRDPGGGQSEESEGDEPPEQVVPPQGPATGDQVPGATGSPPFAASADAGASATDVDAGVVDAGGPAGEQDGDASGFTDAPVTADAGSAAP